jgi:hypothetical protein
MRVMLPSFSWQRILKYLGNVAFIFLTTNSKIPWYLESNPQKEHGFASFVVQRVLFTEQRPSKMRRWFQTFDRRHFFTLMVHRTVQSTERITMNKSPTSASFWTSATCFVWNPRSKTATCPFESLGKSHEWPVTKCDLIGSIFLAAPPAESAWRLTQKPREKST